MYCSIDILHMQYGVHIVHTQAPKATYYDSHANKFLGFLNGWMSLIRVSDSISFFGQ